MDNRATGILLSILFGWCGAYRFYKKQTGLGILYLFTFGLFGIGWVVDIVVSLHSDKSTAVSNKIELHEPITSAKSNVEHVTTPLTQASDNTESDTVSFPVARYDNLDDLFNNIYITCSNPCNETEMERDFISAFLERLDNEDIPRKCLLSRLSTGDLVVYVGKLEVGRIKFNGTRHYMIVYLMDNRGYDRKYEAKTYNFYLGKMNYWIEFILNNRMHLGF